MRQVIWVAGLLGIGVLLVGWLRGPPRTGARGGTVLPGGVLVAYSPSYRVSFFGIERLHPFDIDKMDHIADHLVAQGLLGPDDFAIGSPASDEELASVHDPAYLASLHRTPVLSRALEIWVPAIFPRSTLERRVRGPFRAAVGGTVAAARAAVAHGVGINLGGGFHHAHPAMGHGFCIYNDVALAIGTLRSEGFTAPILIVDTDAHQGDGNHAFFADDPSVTSFSIHQGSLFPVPKVPGDLDVELAAGDGDARLQAELTRWLEVLLDEVQPGLIVHVAGADVLIDDPLTELTVTPDGLVARDLEVLRVARGRGVALLHVLAGGYGPSAATAQAHSVAAMLRSLRQSSG
ncbi:MAG TPA: histone deacetylase [Deltaproteobacteria bacterium]|nr:histone deacetylase [Deltaproteobacteria bacterium]